MSSPDGLHHREGTFAGVDGTLYWQAWHGERAPRALLVIVHGFDDHSSRYAHVGGYFASRGHAVYTFDQIGHGRSVGRRGHVSHFDHYVEDVRRFIAIAQSSVPDSKTFLIGHSQGGMVVLRYGLAYPGSVSGVVTSGAGLMLSLLVPAWKRALSGFLSSIAPTLSLPNDIPAQFLSHDPAMIAARKSDTLMHGRATVRWFAEFLTAQADTLATAPRFTLPCLLLHGRDDRIISPEASRQFYAAAASTDKTLQVYDGLYHELFNELGRERVLADVERWLVARL